MCVDSAIIEKIAKLRRLSTSSNINEALAATRAADKLIAEYRISEAELEISTEEKKPIERDGIPIYQTGRIIPWKDYLSSVLARNYGCALYNHISRITGRKVSSYVLVGRKDDTEICRYMFAWLSTEIDRLCKLNCKGEGHVFCQSYCQGAVDGVNQQFQELNAALHNSAIGSQSVALVRLDNRAQEADAIMRALVKLGRSGPSNARHDFGAYDMGVEAGKRINLHKNLTATSNKLFNK